MRKKWLAWLTAAVLAVGLLSTGALAADWDHSSHSGWTELNENTLTSHSGELTTGKYYFEDTDNDQMVLSDKQLIVGAGQEVTLCLNDAIYFYTGAGDAAVVVEDGGTLTVCCCQMQYGILPLGEISCTNNPGLYAIKNHGTLVVAGGNIFGEAGDIWNDGDLTLSGLPMFTIPSSTEPSVPNIVTYNTIHAADFGLSGAYPSFTVAYYGAPNTAYADGVVLDAYLYSGSFNLIYPENAQVDYDDTTGSLICMGTSSLSFCGESVQDKTYYKVVNDEGSYATGSPTVNISYLEDGTPDDYDLYWDEDAFTLTLNGLEAVANQDWFDPNTAMFQADCGTLTVELVGENTVTALSCKDLVERSTYAFENTGNVVIRPAADITEGSNPSLTIELGLSNDCGSHNTLAGIMAGGDVENYADLSIVTKDAPYVAYDLVGIDCNSFVNAGTFTADMTEDGSSITAIRCQDTFSNSGSMELTIHAQGIFGVNLGGASSFENSGGIQMDLQAENWASGIYSSSTSALAWDNTATGRIEITVSGNGGAIGTGAKPTTGMELRSGTVSLTNRGALSVTATREEPSVPNTIPWPKWQPFNTAGLALISSSATVDNTGSMTLAAENGYSAGLLISAENEDVSITSSGTLQVSATTMGGDGIRAVGIYAEISNISDGQAKNLPLTLRGSVSITAAAATGSTVDAGNLMSLCLVQSFPDGSQPASTGAFQQIRAGSGLTLSGTPTVLGPIAVEVGGGIWQEYVNTIGSWQGGQFIPAAGVTVAPIPSTDSGATTPVGDYIVNVDSGANGKVTVNPGRADQGDTITITVKPDEGYVLDTLTVTDKYGDPVKVTGKGENKYTFTMPGSPVTVEATFFKSGTSRSPFADVSVDAHYYDAVLWAMENGITNGTTDTTFSPDRACTRAQVVTYLWRAAGSPAPRTAVNPFTDVSEDAYYYSAVLWAVENGITNGTSDTTFSPDVTVTRAQTTVFLYRAAGSPVTSGGSTFTDVPADSYYSGAVLWAVENGITNGTSDTTFSPGSPCTRSQIVTFLFRAEG